MEKERLKHKKRFKGMLERKGIRDRGQVNTDGDGRCIGRFPDGCRGIRKGRGGEEAEERRRWFYRMDMATKKKRCVWKRKQIWWNNRR